MILGIGTDLANIERIQAVLDRFGDRFRNRVFTEMEQAKSERRLDVAGSYAKRWAAKEAIAKALGTGIAKGVGWQQMEIQHNELGAPIAILTTTALERLTEIGGKQVLISISDERHYALAFCTII